MKIFGFELGSKQKEIEKQQQDNNKPANKIFSIPQTDDGAVTVAGAGYYGTYVDLDGAYRNETQLITKYRELAGQPEIERALDNIINEAIIHLDDGKVVNINLDNVKLGAGVKKQIEAEFQHILKLLNFGNMGHDIFRRWYIDGRLYYHIIIDDASPETGIKELNYIDPRRIRKVREIQKTRDPATGIDLIKKQIEYYIYNERGMQVGAGNLGSKIAVDSIINVNSGLMDPKQVTVLSHLHKAIKPYNNLRMVEDATVIYRLSRAPERRVFYIDVGNMPYVKADQYVRDMMTKYRNKLVYDSSTGEIKDDRKHLAMLEDFWLPRREGSKGTEISTLEGARNLGEMEDVKYFKTKLYEALCVPISRLETQTGFTLGRTTEITRDELNFNMFIKRVRNKFATIFDDLLRTQLILKQVCDDTEWKSIKEDIWYDFVKDNNFEDLKELEILNMKADALAKFDPFAGRYVSRMWVRQNILKQDEKEIEEINQEMASENEVAAQQQGAADQAEMEKQAQSAMIQKDVEVSGAIQQQTAQAELQKNDQEDNEKMAGPGRAHDQTMMDKKIALEKEKAKNKPKAKPGKKTKTVAEEAREIGLKYMGNGFYGTDDLITHHNNRGILTRIED